MKFIISFILIVLLSFAACLYLPWWSICFAAFLVTVLIPQNPGKAFICAFLALFLLWGGLSFWISNSNGHILAKKISMVILKMENPFVLMLVAGLIGGLVAGFAALAGAYLRKTK